MPAAVILADNTIAAILMADATIDQPPAGFPADAKWLNAPDGCHENWSYDPVNGFAPPASHAFSAPGSVPANKIEF